MQERYRQMYLIHAQSAHFGRRVEKAQRILADFMAQTGGHGDYVAFSGGKDSLCLLILLRQMKRTDVAVFTQGDDLDYPDKRAYCERIVAQLGFRNYTYGLSDVSALAQLQASADDEIHGTFSHVIRRYMQEHQRNSAVMGLRAAESLKRRRLAGWTVRAGHPGIYTVSQTGEHRCIPLYDWSGEDVFALILSTGTEYMHVYDHDDLCMPHQIRFCWTANPEFFSRGQLVWLKRYYPSLYNRLLTVNPDVKKYV